MSWDTLSQIVTEVLAEKARAEKLFPSWPYQKNKNEPGRIEAAAIVAEKAGEVVRAALNGRAQDPHFESHNATITNMRRKLVQTAAMAIRAIENLPELRTADEEIPF